MERADCSDPPRRGRPRKWASETERRAHEAAKRRLRNKTVMTPDEFNDVRALTKLADELQRRVGELTAELNELNARHVELERRHVLDRQLLDALTARERERQSGALQIDAPAHLPTAPAGNRAQRRSAERARRREG